MKSAGLCWGQRYMWLRVHQLPPEHQHETHVVLRFEVPSGITVAQAKAILTHLTRRHEILRTTYRLDPEPGQHVDPPRPLPVRVVTTERDGTPGPVETVEELTRSPFDPAGEWPIRACLVTTGGAPKACVLVFNHLAVDVWTLGEIKRELRTQAAGMAARRPAALSPVRNRPADLARHEASADAAITAARAMAHWQEEVTRLPLDPFARRRAERDGPPARHATLVSPVLPGAARTAAGRHGVWPSLVHVAAYAAMTAIYTGGDSAGFLSFVSNRETHPFPDVMTCMFSPTLVRVDCAGDPSFGELLGRVAGSFSRAREHAYVPYDEIVEMVSREGSRRGGPVLLSSELNFIKQRTKEYGGRRTAFTWNPVPESWAYCGLDTYLRIDEWRDAVSLSLHAMSSVMDAGAVEWFLRGMERLVLAAGDDLRLTELASLVPFAPETATASAMPTTPPSAPADEAVQALLAAVRDAHGLAGVDPSDSYTLAGGRALRIPRVLAELSGRGWRGLTLQQLAGPTPLGALAARLTPVPQNSTTPIPSHRE
ncbi:condensation domain-containing protein [Streptosporangium sp. NPDC004379]|uniref:condensation domain-containing protein n=1 Tax=Streptosporangium sp. NPDC004379 TaxID=3366189 RepID=UPI0036CFEA73